MNNRTRKLQILAALLACVCVVAALAGCSSSSVSSSKSSEALSANDVKVQYTVPTEPFYVLVVGNDTRTGTVESSSGTYADGSARSDTMMLVRVDPVTYKISIVSIPRDTAADVDGTTTKINQAYRYHGIQGALDQVKALTGVTPKYYLDMTFVQFENFINLLGGVDVYVPADMSLQDIVGGSTISLSEGTHHLNGAEALVLARVRKIYEEYQDASRQINDRAIVQAVITMVANDPAIVSSACGVIVENCETSFAKEELEVIVQEFAAHADQITFVSGSGPYDGDSESGDWLAYREEDTWAEIIDVIEAGGDPTDVVPLPEQKVS